MMPKKDCAQPHAVGVKTAGRLPDQVWLSFLEKVLATAQTGLTFARDAYDTQRYEQLRASATELLAVGCDHAPATIQRWLRLDSGYPTPKLDVRGMVFDGQQRVLLVRENSDERWTLPGGWCDIGQSPADAVCREVLEESGLQVRALRLLALLDKLKHPHPPQMPHAHKAFFLCAAIGGDLLQDTDETCGATYFDVDQLPSLSLDRVLPQQIRLLHRRVLEGRIDTLFD